MAYDFALDLETGDWLFGGSRDLGGVTGTELDEQRINIRCKIPRGSFTYDEDGTLGSNLYAISRNPTAQQVSEARGLITQALEPMTNEIAIDDIQLRLLEDGQLFANVLFHPTGSLDPEEELFTEGEDMAQFDAGVTIGD